MSFYYITGISGSGKSSVRSELKRRGYQAFGTDEDNPAFFYHNKTGERVGNHVTIEERTPEWRAQHTWKLGKLSVQELAKAAINKPIFLCGVTANDVDEV